MKKVLFFTTLLLIAIMASAQFESYRSISTAGILKDDIDYIIVPGKLCYVDGFRIYTNLSDFTSTEGAFSGWSPNYLIGTKYNYNDFYMGLLHISRNSMYDIIENSTEIYFEDLLGNTEYNYQYIDSTHYNYSGVNQSEQTYYGIAYGNRETLRFGFAYWRNAYKYASNQEYFNYFDEYALETNTHTSHTMTYFDYNNNYSNSAQTFLLSFFQPVNDMEFGMNFSWTPSIITIDMLAYDSIFHDFSPSDATINDYVDSMIDYGYVYQPKGNGFAGDLRVKKEKQGDIKFEFVTGFSFTNYNDAPYYIDSIVNIDEYSPTFIDDEIMLIDIHAISDSANSYYTGSVNNFNVRFKFIKTLEKANFGMGIRFVQESTGDSFVMSYDRTYTENYDNGNGVDDAGDYVLVENNSYTRVYLQNELVHTIYLPVGMEFNMTNNLVFRLGAETYLSWSNYSDAYYYTSYTPTQGVITDGTGAITEYIVEDPYDREEGASEEHTFSKGTNFYYGMGWYISDNFVIDIMNFANLTNLTGWSISARAIIF